MPLVFEWDEQKAASNLNKHHVSFAEATTAFADPLALTSVDEDHSVDETRYVTVGMSYRGDLLLVVHTVRDEAIRIIGGRVTTVRERSRYEEER